MSYTTDVNTAIFLSILSTILDTLFINIDRFPPFLNIAYDSSVAPSMLNENIENLYLEILLTNLLFNILPFVDIPIFSA